MEKYVPKSLNVISLVSCRSPLSFKSKLSLRSSARISCYLWKLRQRALTSSSGIGLLFILVSKL